MEEGNVVSVSFLQTLQQEVDAHDAVVFHRDKVSERWLWCRGPIRTWGLGCPLQSGFSELTDHQKLESSPWVCVCVCLCWSIWRRRFQETGGEELNGSVASVCNLIWEAVISDTATALPLSQINFAPIRLMCTRPTSNHPWVARAPCLDSCL